MTEVGAGAGAEPEPEIAPETEVFDDEEGEQPYDPRDVPPDREVVTTPYDPPVKSLIADMQSRDLVVNPAFQRLPVWDRVRQSRLIESLLLNVPIPVIFLAEDHDGTRVVVDGQQRLRAIEGFAAGQYALTGLQVLSALNGKRWVDLTPRQARIIENRTLRCIVIAASSDPNLRFDIFERLNTGGISLTDQELRNSIYRGPFNDLLDELATSQEWLAAVRRREPDNRLAHHEMILRFFAMNSRLREYRPPLKTWMSDFMDDHRRATPGQLDAFRRTFYKALRNVVAMASNADAPPFRRARELTDQGEIRWDQTLNRPIFDLQMVGLLEAPPEVVGERGGEIVRALANLCVNDPAFSDALSRATADKARTRTRFAKWAEALTALAIPNNLAERLPAEETGDAA